MIGNRIMNEKTGEVVDCTQITPLFHPLKYWEEGKTIFQIIELEIQGNYHECTQVIETFNFESVEELKNFLISLRKVGVK